MGSLGCDLSADVQNTVQTRTPPNVRFHVTWCVPTTGLATFRVSKAQFRRTYQTLFCSGGRYVESTKPVFVVRMWACGTYSVPGQRRWSASATSRAPSSGWASWPGSRCRCRTATSWSSQAASRRGVFRVKSSSVVQAAPPPPACYVCSKAQRRGFAFAARIGGMPS